MSSRRRQGKLLARERLVALATLLAFVSLLLPPLAAGGDCCELSCDGVCCLLMERAGLGHHGSPGAGETVRKPSWKPPPRLERDAGACVSACSSAAVYRPVASHRSSAPAPPALAAASASAGASAELHAALGRGGASPRGPPSSSRI